MKLRFTKMQGAGNDFVMLDATRSPLELSTEQFRALADRHFGIGADQILVVDPPRTPGMDFGYRIFNASGDEVEHCGNGARCFVRFVHDQGRRAPLASLAHLNRAALCAHRRADRHNGAEAFGRMALPVHLCVQGKSCSRSRASLIARRSLAQIVHPCPAGSRFPPPSS